MVNIDIPRNYTFSPSDGTPHLTINREALIDLDSSNAFEGMSSSLGPLSSRLTMFKVLRSFLKYGSMLPPKASIALWLH